MSRADAATTPARPSIFTNHSFWLLWWAVGISAFGDHLSELGLMKVLRLDERTDKAAIQAQMTFFFFLPYLFVGPFAGWLADRLPRRVIMITADLIRACIVASIPFLLVATGDRPILGAMAPLFIVGMFAAFFSPARLSLLPTLVEDANLTQANSLIGGLSIVGAMISYVVGGWLAQRNPNLNFRLDAVTFVASAVLVFFITTPGWARHRRETAAASARSHPIRDIHHAFHYVRTHRRVLELILLATVFWTAGSAFQSFLPTIVLDWYRHRYTWITSANDYEILGYLKASIGGGMFLGALLLTYFGDALRGQWVITWSLIFAGLSVILFASTSNIYVGGTLSVLVGAFGAGINISVITLLQRLVPDRSLGRVFGIRDLSTMAGLLCATGLIGMGFIPHLDNLAGPALLILGAGLIVVGIYSLFARLKPSAIGRESQLYKNLNEFLCKWWYRCRRVGPCTIPRTGPAIVAANHTCGIDPLIMTAVSPHRLIGFVIATEYYSPPFFFFRRIIRLIGCVPVARDRNDAAGLRAALRHLKNGNVLGIFPEGGIPDPGERRTPRPGIAQLALRSGAPVIPVHISGTRWSESVFWPFFRRHHAVVRFGPPVDLSAYRDRMRDREAIDEATELIMQRIRDLAPSDD